MLRHLSATAATFVNEEQLPMRDLMDVALPPPERELRHGDILRFGGTARGTPRFYDKFVFAVGIEGDAPGAAGAEREAMVAGCLITL